MDLHDGVPFWPRRDGLLRVHGRLRQDHRCDVAVVGGGITGALIALELSRRGRDVTVVDRREIGGGSTSASTALLQYEIDELLIDLADAIGPDDATLAYRECGRGIELVERATQTVGHLCGFRRSPSVFMAIRKADVARLRSEFDARAAAGFDVEWLDSTALRDRWGLTGIAAIESALGGSVDPYALASHALAAVADRGGRVFERTAVERFEFSPRRVHLVTDSATITAEHVVVATGYEVAGLLPELPFRLHSSFALVTQPIAGLSGRYPDGLLFWDLDDPYLYGRTTDDGRLMVGGRDEAYRDPLRRWRAMPSKSRALTASIARRLPDLDDVEVAFSWSGTFAETPDGLAYIGAHSRFPRCQFALGFGGNGITYSALAAEYIAGALDGTEHAAHHVFALERASARRR